MSFQTVLSIVSIVFTAIQLYQRFRQKDSSGGEINTGGEAAVQSPISPITAEPRAELRAEPKHSRAPNRALTERRSEQSSERSADRRPEQSSERSPERSGVQNSEWPDNNLFLTTKMSEQNKLVKMVTDSAVLVGLSAGVGYLAKKILKENFLGDPSSNVMNYVKFTGVLAGSMALKTHLEDQKILPKSI